MTEDEIGHPERKLPPAALLYQAAMRVQQTLEMEHVRRHLEKFKNDTFLMRPFIDTKPEIMPIGLPSIGADAIAITGIHPSFFRDGDIGYVVEAQEAQIFVLDVDLFKEGEPFVVDGDESDQDSFRPIEVRPGDNPDIDYRVPSPNRYTLVVSAEMPPTIAQAGQLHAFHDSKTGNKSWEDITKHVLAEEEVALIAGILPKLEVDPNAYEDSPPATS